MNEMALVENKYRIFVDGNQWCATYQNFVNLQESPAGYGETPLLAVIDLLENNEKKNGLVSVPVERLLKARDALIEDDCNEAYHHIYMAARETTENKLFPWEHLEAMLNNATKEKT